MNNWGWGLLSFILSSSFQLTFLRTLFLNVFHQTLHGMNIKLCPGPFFHHFPGSLQHLASCWQSSVLWQCRSKPSKSKKSNSNLCPTCRPRSSRCRSNYKVFSRDTRWRCSGGKMRRNVRTNFCRLSWMKYRSGWNIEILLWTLKIRRSWTRTYMSAFMQRASLPNKIQGKTGRQFHHTGKKGRVHNWHATPFPLRTI